ncbi:MAG TPA: ABC transporter permease [Baekduia sp.]|uniref:ABC transporter permease n=1 Tax=Baekduia sp. TaxID=2600305 RepID=UPI002BCD0576|nr:ABC transporter permease [Baekduia sp.]HMJ36425.1 ABC transporter permease [Baekduia sp.]
MSATTVPLGATVQESRLEIPPEMGKPIRGPNAFGDDPKRLWRLAWTMAVTDFKLRFFGSALGYLWTLMRPLMLFGVLYFVFAVLFDLGATAKYQPVALLLGIVMFQFLGEATQMGVRSLLQRESLVRKIDFPLLAVPLAAVLTAMFSLVLNFIPITGFLLLSGGRPMVSWIEVPFLMLALALFAFGLVCLLSSLFVRYRDVEPIWDVTMQILFYASPIIYPIQKILDDQSIPQWVPRLLMANPFAAIMQQTRHAFVDPSHLGAAAALGQDWRVMIPIAVTLGVAVIGIFVFTRLTPSIAEEL